MCSDFFLCIHVYNKKVLMRHLKKTVIFNCMILLLHTTLLLSKALGQCNVQCLTTWPLLFDMGLRHYTLTSGIGYNLTEIWTQTWVFSTGKRTNSGPPTHKFSLEGRQKIWEQMPKIPIGNLLRSMGVLYGKNHCTLLELYCFIGSIPFFSTVSKDPIVEN